MSTFNLEAIHASLGIHERRRALLPFISITMTLASSGGRKEQRGRSRKRRRADVKVALSSERFFQSVHSVSRVHEVSERELSGEARSNAEPQNLGRGEACAAGGSQECRSHVPHFGTGAKSTTPRSEQVQEHAGIGENCPANHESITGETAFQSQQQEGDDQVCPSPTEAASQVQQQGSGEDANPGLTEFPLQSPDARMVNRTHCGHQESRIVKSSAFNECGGEDAWYASNDQEADDALDDMTTTYPVPFTAVLSSEEVNGDTANVADQEDEEADVVEAENEELEVGGHEEEDGNAVSGGRSSKREASIDHWKILLPTLLINGSVRFTRDQYQIFSAMTT